MVKNVGLNALCSTALLLVLSNLVSAAPAPTLLLRSPKTGDQLCGPTSFCLGLSPGGGETCIPIEEGCCITVPIDNTIPTPVCSTPGGDEAEAPERTSEIFPRGLKAGEQLCGPTSFCQGLSPGGGDTCTPVPEGCCITVPVDNTIPRPVCNTVEKRLPQGAANPAIADLMQQIAAEQARLNELQQKLADAQAAQKAAFQQSDAAASKAFGRAVKRQGQAANSTILEAIEAILGEAARNATGGGKRSAEPLFSESLKKFFIKIGEVGARGEEERSAEPSIEDDLQAIQSQQNIAQALEQLAAEAQAQITAAAAGKRSTEPSLLDDLKTLLRNVAKKAGSGVQTRGATLAASAGADVIAIQAMEDAVREIAEQIAAAQKKAKDAATSAI